MRNLLLLVFVCMVLLGCATLKDTLTGITQDPGTFRSEAETIAENTKDTLPSIPQITAVAIGYALAFARRWYKEIKKDQSKKIQSS